MKLALLQISLLLILSNFSGCKVSSSTEPPDGLPRELTATEFRNLVLTLTSYDSVVVTHKLGSELTSRDVVSIDIGVKDSLTFLLLTSAIATYRADLNANVFIFRYIVVLDHRKIWSPLTVRYKMADSSFVDIDTTVALFRYPYESAEVVVTDSILPNFTFQDVDRIGNTLYFHPAGAAGLFAFDFSTRQTTELFNYSSGDHIAADSNFVFCSLGPSSIHRFNLTTSTVDLQFFTTDNISGLDTHSNFLFVWFNTKGKLRKYTYDGVLVDSLDVPRNPYFLTLHDSIAYGIQLSPYPPNPPTEITRFDLRTRQYLSNIPSPAYDNQGIKIYNSKMYYCDWARRLIGAVPISELISR